MTTIQPPAHEAYPFDVSDASAPELAAAFTDYATRRDGDDDFDALLGALDQHVNMRALALHNDDLDPFADGTVNYEPGPLTLAALARHVERNLEYRIMSTWDEALTA